MNELTTTLILLFIVTTSATVFIYMIYLEYKRVEHINYIKRMISHNKEKDIALLEAKDKAKDKSLSYKIITKMRLAGFTFSIYLFIAIFFAFLLLVGGLFSWFLQDWIGLVIAFPIGVFLFYYILQTIIIRRRKAFNRALAIAISVLVKMMKNGIGFEQSMFKAIDVSSSPLLKKIFAKFFQEKNTIGEEEAFKNINRYVKSKELKIFALAVKIGRSSGGRFSSTLEKVENTIQYRKKMQEKVDVVTREGAFGSYIVAAIAVFLYFALNANFDGKLHHYFMNSEFGRFQLLGIFLWVATGLMVNKLITRVES